MGSSTYGGVVQLWHLVKYFESASRLMGLFSDSQCMDCALLVGREGTAGQPQEVVYIGFTYLFLNWNS